jgi:type IV secretory pathway TraG/TraD family ATPase VirD4
VLVLAAQRTGKSGIVADRILDHPGPVLATSTRADLYESTAGARALRGPVHAFNPQGVGGVPSSLAWDLLGPCKDLVMARRMAAWLKVPDISGDIRWFEQKGDVALSALLWAAAVTGRTVVDVYEWVQLAGHKTCLEILATHPGSTRQMFAVAKRMFEENRTSGSIRDTVDLTLSWAMLPGLAAAVTPLPGEGFSTEDFTQQCGTLYLIASGDDDSPVTPLFRALASWVHYEAGLAGSKGRYKRLDPPLLMVLDEVTQICPVDLPVMLSDSAGKGVLIEAVCHSKSQLEQRWGEHGAGTVWACSGTKILLGGISDPGTLDAASKLCGTEGEPPHRVVPPELLRMLPDWRALVIRMNLSPVVVKVRPAWRRLGYRLGRHPLPVPQLAAAGASWRETLAAAAMERIAPAPAAANEHGGKPGPLVKAGADERP